MSADNGTYILKTGYKDYFQFRVIQDQAISNLWWSLVDWKEKSEMVPTRVIEYFGNCKYTTDEKRANEIADSMERKNPTEYGKKMFCLNKTWNKNKNEAKEHAVKEIEAIKNRIEEAERTQGKKEDGWDFELKRLQKIIEME